MLSFPDEDELYKCKAKLSNQRDELCLTEKHWTKTNIRLSLPSGSALDRQQRLISATSPLSLKQNVEKSKLLCYCLPNAGYML